MVDAHLTNAITNALHAVFLLAYFLGALHMRVQGIGRLYSRIHKLARGVFDRGGARKR